MITLDGQLAIKTIHGRNGDFNVAKLSTTIGEFVVKNAELDQYREGKYEGKFNITYIGPSSYTTNGRIVTEVRALLGGMTLSNSDQLSSDESGHVSTQEVDPAEEEAKARVAASAVVPAVPPVPAPDSTPTEANAAITATPSPVSAPSPAPAPTDAPTPESDADADLFGTLWPLGDLVKLDATVDRRQLRKQRDRLDTLGYEFRPLRQDWVRLASQAETAR